MQQTFNRNSSSRGYGRSSGRSFSGGGRNGSYSRAPFRRSSGGRGGGGGNRIKTMSVYELEKAIAQSKSNVDTNPQLVVQEIKHKFDDFPISKILKLNIQAKGYTLPTPIQDQVIPVILEGKDLIGTANTGTGKTAAFLIPLIEKISKSRFDRALIITPIRELSGQILEEFRDFSRGMGLDAALCIGGTNIFRQKSELRRNPPFVIGTPGRLRDLIKQGILDLSKFNNVVLDETDQMVDIGFLEEIKFFISLLPKNRQSLFFSATVGPKVRDIIKAFVQNPVVISVKHRETSADVDQQIVRVTGGVKKMDVLHDLLSKKEFEKVLIFGRTKHGVQKLCDELIRRGFRAGAIHGDKRQNQRQFTLNQFKKNDIKILLATDVASRGLDIKNVSHVINYELPESQDDYTHRIGRTGRAGKKGVAITIVD